MRAMPGGFATTSGGGILGDAQLPPSAGGGRGDGINRRYVVADEWRRENVKRMERHGNDECSIANQHPQRQEKKKR